MKPVLRQITTTSEYSFLVRKDIGESMINNWHYHPEFELLFIRKSAGTWLIGNHIGHFTSGDIVLIGPNLPHCFRHEDNYLTNGTDSEGESICIKVLPGIFGAQFLNLPETRAIRDLFLKSGSGLKLTGRLKSRIAWLMEKICMASTGLKLVNLLVILQEIAESREYLTLSPTDFVKPFAEIDNKRINKIFEYTFSHYTEKISVEKVAALINMTTPSFCRYFKGRTNKTFIQFLMEVRIGQACRLLVEDEKNVSEISYDCGYNTISHFNHQFKIITGKNPLDYKRDYLKNNVPDI
jgi:AraC-like DNA-binding protein